MSASRLVRACIHAYQGLRAGRPTSCRFHPSCSAYADEAIERYGVLRGGRMALARLARCRPFGSHGIDAVPTTEHGMGR